MYDIIIFIIIVIYCLVLLPHSGPTWNFNSADIMASLSLQDGPRSGIIIFEIQQIASSENQYIAP
jgi:hypothetical protein